MLIDGGPEILSGAYVLCFAVAIPVRNSYFGQGDNMSILLDDVMCYGNETSMESCRSITSLTSDIECSHLEDAGVICNGEFRYACAQLI